MPVVKPTFNKPVIMGSMGIWGDLLNKIIDQVDGFQGDVVTNITGIETDLGRLEQEKLSLKDADKLIEVKVNNYIEIHTKPDLDAYVEGLKTNNIRPFVLEQMGEINTFTEAQKIELDERCEAEKLELDAHEKLKEGELDTHEKAKEVEITTHTDNEIIRISAHVNGVEIPRLTARADREIERIRAVGVDGILDEIDFTTGDEFHFDRDENSDDPIGDFRRGKTYKLGELVDKIWEEKQFKVDKDLQTTSKTVVGAINEVNAKKVEIGKGLERVNEVLNVVSEDEGILVNEKLKLNVVDDLLTGGVKRPLSAEQGKVLKQLIDAIGTGGVAKLMRKAELLGEYDYIGNLPASGTSIATGKQLFNPNLYLDGVKMNKNQFSVELQTGLITLTKAYSDKYDVTWVVEDDMTPHIKFCFPTMNLLIASEDMKGRIQLDDVIKILGTSEADDGGHYLVKCESTAKLNPVELSAGKYLNEIPNTRIATLKGEIDKNKSDILLKRDITDKNFGRDLTLETLGHRAQLYKGTSEGDKTNIYKYLPDENSWNVLFDNQNCPISKASNGWMKLANGMIIQWGTIYCDGQAKVVIFPIAFSTINYTFVPQFIWETPNYICGCVTKLLRANAIDVIPQYIGGTQTTENLPYYYGELRWIAIGY